MWDRVSDSLIVRETVRPADTRLSLCEMGMAEFFLLYPEIFI